MMETKPYRPPLTNRTVIGKVIRVDRDLLRIEQKLDTVRGILYRAAHDAEALKDQGLAEDLHLLHSEIRDRILPSVRAGKSVSTLDSYRA